MQELNDSLEKKGEGASRDDARRLREEVDFKLVRPKPGEAKENPVLPSLPPMQIADSGQAANAPSGTVSTREGCAELDPSKRPPKETYQPANGAPVTIYNKLPTLEELKHDFGIPDKKKS